MVLHSSLSLLHLLVIEFFTFSSLLGSVVVDLDCLLLDLCVSTLIPVHILEESDCLLACKKLSLSSNHIKVKPVLTKFITLVTMFVDNVLEQFKFGLEMFPVKVAHVLVVVCGHSVLDVSAVFLSSVMFENGSASAEVLCTHLALVGIFSSKNGNGQT